MQITLSNALPHPSTVHMYDIGSGGNVGVTAAALATHLGAAGLAPTGNNTDDQIVIENNSS